MYKSNSKIEKEFLEVLEKIEVSDDRYKKAINSYKSVGEWLNRYNSTLKEFNPKLYCQGSFRLGTAIKPLSAEDEYDVDIVCELELEKRKITQEELKKMVGLELDEYIKSKNMKKDLTEGKRCWTLTYSDEAKFHIDVLPCIPNHDLDRENGSFTETAIDITDNTLPYYKVIHNEWNCSNPVGYHNWFKDRMRVIYSKQEKILLEYKVFSSLEQIPEYKIKTPLQKVIQLLKRHRDIMFEDGESENKPISIIISTLAAKAYNNEDNLVDAFCNIINRMENYIEQKNGIYWIANPVNNQENFADKWQSHPDRKVAFFKWIRQLKSDYSDLSLNMNNNLERINLYESMFGDTLGSQNKASISDINLNDLRHRQSIKWKSSDRCIKCKIIAFKNRYGNYRYNYFNSGEEIKKGRSLKFKVKSDIDLKGCEIYWRVTNTGSEARKVNCLRGDFYESKIEKGKQIRKEDACYKGLHTVECFIIKNGFCIGTSEPFIVNIV